MKDEKLDFILHPSSFRLSSCTLSTVPEFFRTNLHQTVNVIELSLPQSLDVVEFDRLNDSMKELLNGKGAGQWVIDFSSVSYIGSAMLGLIVNVRQQVKTAGGKLVLCGMSPRLLDIFRMCSMERLFTITKTRADAIKVLGR
jgi:anti-anti-sigma factor